MTLKVPVRKFVPYVGKAPWTECLTKALNDTRTYGDEKSWIELNMLTKCVLQVPFNRGG